MTSKVKQKQEFMKLATIAENPLIKVSTRLVLTGKYGAFFHGETCTCILLGLIGGSVSEYARETTHDEPLPHTACGSG